MKEKLLSIMKWKIISQFILKSIFLLTFDEKNQSFLNYDSYNWLRNHLATPTHPPCKQT